MSKLNLESLVKAAPGFIKTHKTSCFLAGAVIYASSLYMDYQVWANWKKGNWGNVVLYGLSGRIPSFSGLALMGAPAWFYYSKQVLGRKRAAKTFRYLSNLKAYTKTQI